MSHDLIHDRDQSFGAEEGLTLQKIKIPDWYVVTFENRNLWKFIIGSIIIHGILFAGAEYLYRRSVQRDLVKMQSLAASVPAALQTRVYSAEDLARAVARARNIVQSAPAHDSIPTQKNRPAEYLGERTQRVTKETRAATFGNLDGGALRAIEKSETRVEKSKTHASNELKLAKLGLGSLSQGRWIIDNAGEEAEKKRAQSKEKAAVSAGNGQPKGNHDLLDRDVAVGAETILNTDEFKYASFFNRLKSEVAPRWEPLVGQIVSKSQTPSSGGGGVKSTLHSNFYSTEARFAMDDEGSVVDVQIAKSSGVEALDRAAIVALRQILRLKNPPRALREKDGLYRMNLGFVVNLQEAGVKMDYVPDERLLDRDGRL